MSYARKVPDNGKVRLKDFDPNHHDGLEKEEGKAATEALGREMQDLQDLMFFAGQTSLLVVLQGLDTSGKDGTIRCILSHVNAQSCRVAPFKVPTEKELAHDFLWRVHAETPAKGGMTIFNRSHYEDVLVAKVHGLAADKVIEERYEHINDFEKLLADSGTVILKFFLHIDKAEQEKRLLAREQDATKSWKLSVGDWKERESWDEYQGAYETVLNRCSTDRAPWFVVPANRKWFRDLAVVETIVKALRPLRGGWMNHLEEVGKEQKALLEAYRKQRDAAK